MSLINYQGDSKIIKRICQLLKVTDVQDGEGHSLVGSDGIAVVTGGGGGSSTLSGLSDVDTSGVSSGDVLAYNGTSQKWEDKTLASVALSGSYNDLSNKPTIPDELSDLSDDSTHRLVTDNDKTAWSAKVDDNPTFSEASTRANIDSGDSFATILGKIKKFFTDLKTVAFTGSYSDLSNQPTIPSVSANPSITTATLSGIEIDGTAYAVQGGSANVQSDWNETDTTADDYIKNKPTIPTVTADGAKQGVIVDSGKYRANLVKYSQLSYLCGQHAYSGDVSDRTYEIILDQGERLCVIIPWEDYVKSDWNATSGKAEILNKPTIPAAVAVKGNAESSYRTGNVNLTPANIGAVADSDRGATVFKVTRNLSVDLGTTGYWAAMCNSGGPSNKWWHIISTDWTGNDNKNWISQLAIATQDANGVWWRRNDSGGTAITSSTWHRLAEGDANGSATSCNGYTLGKSVPSNAVFTDTNNAVTQTNTTGSANYRLLYSATADSTTRTEGARKGKLLVNPNVNAIFGESGQKLYFGGSDESTYWIFHGVWSGAWSLNPNGDNKNYLGQSGARWRTVYAVNGSINTSDRNKKKDIEELDDFARDFIMALKPVSYKRIDGDRTHYGMIAQDVEDSMTEFGMTSMDFAGLCKDTKDVEYYEEEVNEDGEVFKMLKHRKIEGEFDYGLRYEEFIAPMIKTIQLQQQEIEMLKQRLGVLEKVKD